MVEASSGGESSIFYFESDQLAFKGNEDYHQVLSSLAKFEAIRNKALQDLDKLVELKQEAIKNPIQLVRRLQTDPKSLDIPARPCIPEVPTIDWSKYSYSATDEVSAGKNYHGTRGRKVHVPEALMQKRIIKPDDIHEDVTIIRGRVKSDQKSETFNQLWTSEEQRKLEDLLIKFPSERVEARRYRKIADELGTKTLQQVASRIQKYFIRLAQSGLPVPGKVPSLAGIKKKSRHKHQMKNRPAMPSTFLQAYVPPIFMPEDDEFESIPSASGSVDSDSEDDDSDLDLPDELKDTEEYKELISLKNLRTSKLCAGEIKHEGYQCDGCGQEPIIGIRYHCKDCPTDQSIDFCSLCSGRRITLGNHRPGHSMQAVNNTQTEEKTNPTLTASTSQDVVNDRDYLPCKFNIPGNYNYLDPNYMPDSAT